MHWVGVSWFWIFILVISLAGVVQTMLRNYQREKTIRMAIEKGVTLDPAALTSLQRNPNNPEDTRRGLLIGSIVTFSVGCGLMVMGYVLGLERGGPLVPLFGVGGLLWCISLGLFFARYAVSTRSS